VPTRAGRALLPLLSGLFCFWVGYEVIRQSSTTASASVLVALGLGVPLVIAARLATHSDFFHRPAVAYDSIWPSGRGPSPGQPPGTGVRRTP
jgi:hypothetical protein